MLTRYRTIMILNVLLVIILILGLDGIIASLQTAYWDWKMESIEETELPNLITEHHRLEFVVDSLTTAIDSLPRVEAPTIEKLREIAGEFRVTIYQLDRIVSTGTVAGRSRSKVRFRGSLTSLLGFLNRCENNLNLDIGSLRLGRYSEDGRTLTLDITMDLPG